MGIVGKRRDRPWQTLTRSAAIPHRLSEFIGNQSENKLSEIHVKIMVRPQIAWWDALRACIPKCMQIVHTLDPRGFNPLTIIPEYPIVNHHVPHSMALDPFFFRRPHLQTEHQGSPPAQRCRCPSHAWFFDRLAMFYGNSKSTTYGNNGYLMGYLMMNHGLAIHYGALIWK